MITLRMLKILLVVIIVSFVTGCKIAVMVVEGGEVQTTDYYTWGTESVCTAGTICIQQVNDTTYAKTFTAIPKPGWRFVKWAAGDDYLCAKSTAPACEVSNKEYTGNAIVEAIVASTKTYYLMPIFAPLTEIGATVTMNGKAWAPMNSFGDLSWGDINAVCPATNGGHCMVDGQLMQYDMTGWTWASVDDVNALFSSFPLYPGGPVTGVPSPAVGLFFLREGFPATSFVDDVCAGCSTYTWNGWTSTASSIASQAYLADVFLRFIKVDIKVDAKTSLTDATSAGHSAWFYRTP